jgi:hypothetical protein
MSDAMLSKQVRYNGATITVRRADVRARLRTSLAYTKLGGIPQNMPMDDWLFMNAFTQFVTQCTVEGDLGFPMPSLTDDDATFQAAFEAFLSADGDLYDVVNNALIEVNRAPAPEEDAKKKTTSEAP